MDKSVWIKWAMLISFIVLLVGGLNYLLMGLLEFNLFGEIFGFDTVVGRVINLLFGLSALILVSIVIYKTYYNKQEKKPARAVKRTTASTTA